MTSKEKKRHAEAEQSSSSKRLKAKKQAETCAKQLVPFMNHCRHYGWTNLNMDVHLALRKGEAVSNGHNMKITYVTHTDAEMKSFTYTLYFHHGAQFTPENILGELHDRCVDKHPKHSLNQVIWDNFIEDLDIAIMDPESSGLVWENSNSRWEWRDVYPLPDTTIVDEETSLVVSDNSLNGHNPLLQHSVGEALSCALHHSSALGDDSGRNSISQLIFRLASSVNLERAIIVHNIGSGARGPNSLLFNHGHTFRNPDLSVTLSGLMERIVLLQVVLKNGNELTAANRDQLYQQMLGSLLVQHQVVGLLMCSAKAELYFVHRSKGHDRTVRLFELQSYVLHNNLKPFLEHLRKLLVYQACTFLIDPLHSKAEALPLRLTGICRSFIHQQLGKNSLQDIHHLPLPTFIKNYLLYQS